MTYTAAVCIACTTQYSVYLYILCAGCGMLLVTRRQFLASVSALCTSCTPFYLVVVVAYCISHIHSQMCISFYAFGFISITATSLLVACIVCMGCVAVLEERRPFPTPLLPPPLPHITSTREHKGHPLLLLPATYTYNCIHRQIHAYIYSLIT